MTSPVGQRGQTGFHAVTRPAAADGKGRVAFGSQADQRRRAAVPTDRQLSPAFAIGDTVMYQADALSVLSTLPADSVDCCITSPPYWRLRDYGIPATPWGGDPDCRHDWLEDRCQACGALLDVLGLESSINAYVQHMVEVFRAVRCVLKPTGTLWLNLGDCYNSGTSAPRSGSPGRHGYWKRAGSMGDRRVRAAELKTKDLAGIPWRVALALQADGWYLRSDIIWAKPNPLPEAVRDRPVRAHEYVFLLTKSDRYFYDTEATREPSAEGAGGRARRSVWTLPTQRCPDAHFATFPDRLVEPCLLAGTSAGGCCSACGAPRVRKVHVSYASAGGRRTNGPRSLERRHATAGFRVRLVREAATAGWTPSCSCRAPTEPAIAIDPFAGSGTTLRVASQHGRRAIGIELNPDYVAVARRRLDQKQSERRR